MPVCSDFFWDAVSSKDMQCISALAVLVYLGRHEIYRIGVTYTSRLRSDLFGEKTELVVQLLSFPFGVC